MQQIKQNIVVLLLLGIVAVCVCASNPWPPPPLVPPDSADESPPPAQARPLVVDRLVAPVQSIDPPASLPPAAEQKLPGRPSYAVLPSSIPAQGAVPNRSGPASPFPLMVNPTVQAQKAPVRASPSQVNVEFGLPPAPSAPKVTPEASPPLPMPQIPKAAPMESSTLLPPPGAAQTQDPMPPIPPGPNTKLPDPPPAPKLPAPVPPEPVTKTVDSPAPTLPPVPPAPTPKTMGQPTAPLPSTEPMATSNPVDAPAPAMPPVPPLAAPKIPAPPAVPAQPAPAVAKDPPPQPPDIPAPKISVPPPVLPREQQAQPAAPTPPVQSQPKTTAAEPSPPMPPSPGPAIPKSDTTIPKLQAVPVTPLPGPSFIPVLSPTPSPAPAPVPVPEQPKRPPAFRLVHQPQAYDPPMPQEPGSGLPTGTQIASSLPIQTAPPVFDPPPAPVQQKRPALIVSQAPVVSTPAPQQYNPPAASQNAPPANSTPVTLELTPTTANFKAGDVVIYDVVLRNPAMVHATNVQVEFEFQGLRFERAYSSKSTLTPSFKNGRAAFTFADFPGRMEKRFKIQVRATKNAVDCSATGMVDGPPAAGAVPGNGEPPINVPGPASSGQSLSISVSGPGSAELNQQVTFVVRVVNTGTRPVTPMLRVSLPSGLKHPSGPEIEGPFEEPLPPGGEKPIRVHVTAVQPGRHTLSCSVVAPQVREASAQFGIMIGKAGLQVQQQPTYKLLTGQANEVRFQVINNSPQNLHRVAVTDTLPDGVELVPTNNEGFYHSGARTVSWVVDLGPHQSKVLSLQVQPQRAGEWSNEVLARADDGPEVISAARLQADGYANLHVKVGGPVQIEAGKTIIYQVSVRNDGSAPATNVQVKALLSDGLVSNGAQAPVSHRVQGRQFTFAPLAQINPQESKEFFIGVLAESAGERGVRVDVACDQSPQPISRNERTMVLRD